jgi:hypothetical protein
MNWVPWLSLLPTAIRVATDLYSQFKKISQS